MTRDDLCVVIGRFSPYHNGHKQWISKACAQFTNVLILIGSEDRARCLHTPWTVDERRDMMRFDYPNLVAIEGIRDYPYPYKNQKWIKQVQDKVQQYSGRNTKISILCNTDARGTTPYIEFFPEWEKHYISTRNDINATMIRELYFNQTLDGHPVSDKMHMTILRNMVPNNTFLRLREDYLGVEYKALQETYHKMLENRAQFGAGPHMTTDMIVTCQKHVLLVTRKNHPGQGLLAMPGGYLEPGLTLEQNAIKELVEETGISLTDSKMPKGLGSPRMFDAVNRSSTGRNVTAVYHVDIKSKKLPAVKGGDDAMYASWYPISEVMDIPYLFHDDHFHILEVMLHGRKKSNP